MKKVVHIVDVRCPSISAVDRKLISHVQSQVSSYNLDNISRTEAYLSFFRDHPEIKWSFLAHMVSRNAGWNMCDLEGQWLPKVMGKEKRMLLYETYERANWLIFHDAFPQLLLYQYSTKMNAPMFHLLPFFHVSRFMEREWQRFWTTRDQERLLIALIINEQNVIQQPVIKHPFYRKRVFHSLLFSFQDWFHYSCVLFPTIQGEIFGASVNGFKSVSKRIDLGKRLSAILFHQRLYPFFFEFAQRTEHTGSRFDYEQYLLPGHVRTTPELRSTFPLTQHHIQYQDWTRIRKEKSWWFTRPVKHRHTIVLTKWYKDKQRRLHRGIFIQQLFMPQRTRKKRVRE